jgi:MoxR-like ATPase
MPETALIDFAAAWLRRLWPFGALAVLPLLAWHFQARAVANADAMRAQAAEFKQAQAAATQLAQATLQHEQAVYAAKATEADNAYQAQLADTRDAAERYIAAHRVQSTPAQGRGGGALASAQGGGSAIPANLPADTVVVSADDVQACSSATTYALKAHDWAGSINP